MKTLFIDVCISPHTESRTRAFCKEYITKNCLDIEIDELPLYQMKLEPLDKAALNKRDNLIAKKEYTDDMFKLARQFKDAQMIIIGAPYWDLSFPSLLKVYVEHIMVNGLTFKYEDGKPIGLCQAKKLVYITTAGGYIGNYNFGFDYIKTIANTLGIKDTDFVSKEGLDIK